MQQVMKVQDEGELFAEVSKYSISRGEGSILQFDPPIGSIELATALSIHFPLQLSLEDKMRAALFKHLSENTRETLIYQVAPEAVSGTDLTIPPSMTSGSSPPSHHDTDTTEDFDFNEIITSHVAQETSEPSSFDQDTGPPETRSQSSAKKPGKRSIPGSLIWDSRTGEVQSKRLKRCYGVEEGLEVARNRTTDSVCKYHRQRKTKCHPKLCPNNKLFRSNAILELGQSLHEDTPQEQQFLCPYRKCRRHTGKRFSTPERVNQHLRRVHNKPGIQQYQDIPTNLNRDGVCGIIKKPGKEQLQSGSLNVEVGYESRMHQQIRPWQDQQKLCNLKPEITNQLPLEDIPEAMFPLSGYDIDFLSSLELAYPHLSKLDSFSNLDPFAQEWDNIYVSPSANFTLNLLSSNEFRSNFELDSQGFLDFGFEMDMGIASAPITTQHNKKMKKRRKRRKSDSTQLMGAAGPPDDDDDNEPNGRDDPDGESDNEDNDNWNIEGTRRSNSDDHGPRGGGSTSTSGTWSSDASDLETYFWLWRTSIHGFTTPSSRVPKTGAFATPRPLASLHSSRLGHSALQPGHTFSAENLFQTLKGVMEVVSLYKLSLQQSDPSWILLKAVPNSH